MNRPSPIITPNQVSTTAQYQTLRLPRVVEADPRKNAIEALLKTNCKLLWSKSLLLVPEILLTPPLANCLKTLYNRKQLQRGLEGIERLLNKEKKGLLQVQQKQGQLNTPRISRVLMISNDGSERFYRECENVLVQHQDRLLIICLNATSLELAQFLRESSNKVLKAIMISDRNAVSQTLFSLLPND